MQQTPSRQELPANFSGANAAAGNGDLANLAPKPYARDRSADRAQFDFGDRSLGKDTQQGAPRVNQSHEKDVLDNFMSLPKQQ